MVLWHFTWIANWIKALLVQNGFIGSASLGSGCVIFISKIDELSLISILQKLMVWGSRGGLSDEKNRFRDFSGTWRKVHVSKCFTYIQGVEGVRLEKSSVTVVDSHHPFFFHHKLFFSVASSWDCVISCNFSFLPFSIGLFFFQVLSLVALLLYVYTPYIPSLSTQHPHICPRCVLLGVGFRWIKFRWVEWKKYR